MRCLIPVLAENYDRVTRVLTMLKLSVFVKANFQPCLLIILVHKTCVRQPSFLNLEVTVKGRQVTSGKIWLPKVTLPFHGGGHSCWSRQRSHRCSPFSSHCMQRSAQNSSVKWFRCTDFLLPWHTEQGT